MISALHKSRQLYLITLDRVSDYFDLLRVELKIQEHNIALRIAGFAVAVLFSLLATVFLGLAIIVSFWDSPLRALAAWFVVLLYGGIAGVCLNLALKHFRSQPIANTLRTEFRRDLDVIKESV
ncbi:phage holin family protein [Noviherbaspirillum sp. UKPF54]|uniref:phage holin family protein n=1 Tax=Noviherbaspirillum sp. UKPF54 TaxID=2601898 RepID=UPI0011B1C3ED|nr:phage holin family protein [Noviherbaspirillum sp. UKPF54]QDZ27074.1 phage holin family protein [Noviherbaspirillum sp. UKPF54]